MLLRGVNYVNSHPDTGFIRECGAPSILRAMGRLKAHPAQHDGNELDKCVGTYWKLKKTDRVCIFQARIIKKNNFIFFYPLVDNSLFDKCLCIKDRE